MKPIFLALAACISITTPQATAGVDDVTAREPLITPLFTIDPASPEVIDGFLDPGDLLLPPGPNMPTREVDRQNLGLGSPFDNVNAVSLSATGVEMTDTFVMIFSVDRAAVGGTPPDPNVAAMGFPFNVQDQASKQQAAGDAFMSLLLFDRTGFIPPNKTRPRGSAVDNSVLVINGGDAGGVDFNVTPATLSPTSNNPSGNQSNVNGGSGTQPSSKGLTGAGAGGEWPQSFVLFSLAIGSPSLSTLPGTNSPADVYIDFDPNSPSGQKLYVGPFILGLVSDDDIDALVIFESGDLSFTSGSDQIVFSLAPGSPSLGADFSPGDLLVSTGFGSFTEFCPADRLGLAASDNLNMLDFVPCDDVLSCVDIWAIGFIDPPCPWDLDGDGTVGLADLAILLAAFGTCTGDAGFVPEADFDGNGCIDLSDLAELLAHFGDVC